MYNIVLVKNIKCGYVSIRLRHCALVGKIDHLERVKRMSRIKTVVVKDIESLRVIHVTSEVGESDLTCQNLIENILKRNKV